MTPEEQNLISSLFDRLGQASNQPKDAEADQLIRSKVAEIPSSPYLLVQSALVMQQALSNAQSRIATLEKQVTEAKTGAGSQQTGGSFLSCACDSTTATCGLRVSASSAPDRGWIFARRFNDRRWGRRRGFVISRD